MLFVEVHCNHEESRKALIPLSKVTEVITDVESSDMINTDYGIYYPSVQGNFYMSIKDIKAWED